MSSPARIQLGKHVVDKGLLDRHGLRCGKVDDLVFDDDGHGAPRLVAILTGPGAFAATFGHRFVAVVAAVHRLFGVEDTAPVEIPWEHVDEIDVVVHLGVDSEHGTLQALPRAVGRLFTRIPGA